MRRSVSIVSFVVLAAVFLSAAWAKWRDPAGTRTGAVDLGVPDRWAGGVARVLPMAEAVVVVSLAVGVVIRPVAVVGAGAALTLLAAFTVAVVRTLRAGRSPRCHCFGSRGGSPIGADTVVRNLALSALALVVLIG